MHLTVFAKNVVFTSGLPWGKENMKGSEKNHKDKSWKAGCERRRGEAGDRHISDPDPSRWPSHWAVLGSRLTIDNVPREEKASPVSLSF